MRMHGPSVERRAENSCHFITIRLALLVYPWDPRDANGFQTNGRSAARGLAKQGRGSVKTNIVASFLVSVDSSD